MRIGMLLSGPLPPVEGIGFYAWNLAVLLRDEGHTVHLVTRGGSGPVSEQVNGIHIWRPLFLPFYPLHVHLHGIFVAQWLRKLEPALDLLHLHSPLVPVPCTHLPMLVTVHTPLRADIRAALAAGSPLSPGIRLQAPVSFALERALFRRASRVVAVSGGVAADLEEYGFRAADVPVVGNGVDTRFFTPSELPKQGYFLTVGRLAPRKGLEDFIDAAAALAELTEARFLIAGEGPLRASLEARIRQKNLQGRVQLLGHIQDRAALRQWYRGALAYVHPAHYEGLSTALLEAMACGSAILATQINGVQDALEANHNSLLVPPGQPAQLAGQMLNLYSDARLGLRLGAAARQTAEERFSWPTIGARYLAIYRQMLEQA